MPADFRLVCFTVNATALQAHYYQTRTVVEFWLSQLSRAERDQRKSILSKLAYRRCQQGADTGREQRERQEFLAAEAAKAMAKAEPRTIAQIIETERNVRLLKEARRPNPLAGLTGFERQLAAAELHGVRDNIKIGRADPTFSIIGSAGAMCLDSGGDMRRG
jgi:hypothetical protein